MSPEVLKDEEITSGACDLWALGCITYKLRRGKSPFFAETEYLIFQNIKKHCDGSQQITFDDIFDKSTKEFILGLLRSVPSQRLGIDHLGDIGEVITINTHPFFRDTCWETILQMNPPLHPERAEGLESSYRN